MYKASELMKMAILIAIATKTGNTGEQGTKAQKAFMHYFVWCCPWKCVFLYCVVSTSVSKTIKLRETFCVFPRIGQKWSKKHDKTIAVRRALCECGLVHTDLYVQARRYRFVYKLVRTEWYVQTCV